jgi:hypothetical protein
MEIWKDIPKFNNEYQISNFGRIRSKHAVIIRSNGTTHTRASKILKPANDKGYLKGAVCVDKKMITYKIHRLVAEAFVAGCDETKEVNHIDGNKSNNHFLNLEWVNRSENMKHAVKIGLLPVTRGSERTQAKMTEQDVLMIRKMMKEGVPRKDICKKLNISVHMYKDVQRGKTWRHV